jgi:hypothetical protein
MTMNPNLSVQPVQLSQHFAHAGGWEKLGWQTIGVDLEAQEEVVMLEDGEGGRYA